MKKIHENCSKSELKTRSTRRRTAVPTRTGGRASGQIRTVGRTVVHPTVRTFWNDYTAVHHYGTTVRLLQLPFFVLFDLHSSLGTVF